MVVNCIACIIMVDVLLSLCHAEDAGCTDASSVVPWEAAVHQLMSAHTRKSKKAALS